MHLKRSMAAWLAVKGYQTRADEQYTISSAKKQKNIFNTWEGFSLLNFDIQDTVCSASDKCIRASMHYIINARLIFLVGGNNNTLAWAKKNYEKLCPVIQQNKCITNHAGLAFVTVKGGAGHRFMKGTEFTSILNMKINHYSKHFILIAHCRSYIKVNNKQRIM